MEPGFAIRNSSDGTIASLERALTLLEHLGGSAPLHMTELAQQLEVPKGSLHRHLAVLERRGYVARDHSKRYTLGPRLISLGYDGTRQQGLTEVARPAMVQLRDRFNESTLLAVLSAGEVVHVHVEESRHPVKMAAEVGERTAAHVSSLGKAILAWSDPSLVDEVVGWRGLARYTANTHATQEALEADLRGCRQRGYTLDEEESAVGLRCVGAPILGVDGRPVAAISLSGPAERLPQRELGTVAPAVCEAAASISRELGWRDSPYR